MTFHKWNFQLTISLKSKLFTSNLQTECYIIGLGILWSVDNCFHPAGNATSAKKNTVFRDMAINWKIRIFMTHYNPRFWSCDHTFTKLHIFPIRYSIYRFFTLLIFFLNIKFEYILLNFSFFNF